MAKSLSNGRRRLLPPFAAYHPTHAPVKAQGEACGLWGYIFKGGGG